MADLYICLCRCPVAVTCHNMSQQSMTYLCICLPHGTVDYWHTRTILTPAYACSGAVRLRGHVTVEVVFAVALVLDIAEVAVLARAHIATVTAVLHHGNTRHTVQLPYSALARVRTELKKRESNMELVKVFIY